MKDVNKLKDYRLKYKRYYGIDFSNDYEIHHIDLDHGNNAIENLLLLPKKLHRQYHFYLNALAPYIKGGKITLDISVVSVDRVAGITYTRDMVQGLLETMNACQEWVAYKAQLDFKKQFEG